MITTDRTSRAPLRAFTLVEMLVVVSIVAITVLAILPAFSRIIQSNNYASAVNAVSAALARANSRGVEGGVVFLFDPRTERITLLTVELHNADASLRASEQGRVPAIAFRPVPGSQPVQLPPGFGVYGLSFLHDDLAGGGFLAPPAKDDAWYPEEAVWENDPSNGTVRRMRYNPWLFPRNDFSFFASDFDPADYDDPDHPLNLLPADDVQDALNPIYDYDPDPENTFRHAQTFFVWFGADGSLRTAASMPPGVRDCYLEFPDLPYDVAFAESDPERLLDLDDRFDPQAYFEGNGGWPILNPEVHMRPAEQIAVVEFARMTEGTGVRAPWYYRATSNEHPNAYLGNEGADRQATFEFDPLVIPGDDSGQFAVTRIQNWIDANAEIIGFNRYSGQALKR